MQTENTDLAHRSSTEPLVDLFFELEDVVSGMRLRELLEASWRNNPLSTLKIVFNARSIHLGKSSRVVPYKCFGWLAERHPLTLLENLQWLSRPVIEKTMREKKADEEADLVMVEPEKDAHDPSRFDMRDGVAHGYWKDLLNILVLAVDGTLDVLANPKDLLNIENHGKKSERIWEADKAKEKRRNMQSTRRDNAIKSFNDNAFYRTLHMVVARLFAERLASDLKLLRSQDKKAMRQISL